MNSPLAIQVMRFAFLVLLWLFVFATVRVIRSDLRAAATARPDRPAGPSHLVITAGDLAGTRISLTGAPVLIGRAHDSTVVLTDDYASTRHARITQTEGRWFLEDLGSTNGTYLGQHKVDSPVPLEPGVPVRIGKTVLELR